MKTLTSTLNVTKKTIANLNSSNTSNGKQSITILTGWL